MKRILIILTIGLLSFALGWWTNDLRKIDNGATADEQGSDNLRKNNSMLADSTKVTKAGISKKKTIRDYISDDTSIHWSPQHPDTTKYICEISLHRITALYWYHGQCVYDYFTYLTSDTTIDVLWSYRNDCVLNMDFLEKSNGKKKYPKRGDTFATITLTNDTTLNVTYHFPDWTAKVNEIAKDSLFPRYYFLEQDN